MSGTTKGTTMDPYRPTSGSRLGAADAAAYRREYANMPARRTETAAPTLRASRLRASVGAAREALRALMARKPQAGR